MLPLLRIYAAFFPTSFTDEILSDDDVTLAARNVPVNGQTLRSIDVNVEMMSEAATSLKASFNPGPDGVPSAFLKTSIARLLIPLHRLFCMLLSSGIFIFLPVGNLRTCFLSTKKEANEQWITIEEFHR